MRVRGEGLGVRVGVGVTVRVQGVQRPLYDVCTCMTVMGVWVEV